MVEIIGLDADVEVNNTPDGVQFVIKTVEGGLLIGENGKTLVALSHILKKINENKTSEDEQFSFSIDINDYQAKKIEELKNLARVNAQRVRYFKKEVVLRPMTSFERRIVHMILTECPDIVTESRGAAPNRQVVIKPYNS